MKSLMIAAAAALALGYSLASHAQNMKLAELLDKQAKRLEKSEVEQLVPGANVYNKGIQTERWWTNSPEGKIRAARQAGSFSNNRASIGEGSWRVNERGQYCVDLLWGRAQTQEKWCRYLFKVGDVLYGAASLSNPDAGVYRLDITK